MLLLSGLYFINLEKIGRKLLKQKIRAIIYYFTGILEIILSTVIMLVLIILAMYLVFSIFTTVDYFTRNDALTLFLTSALNLVVGVEFVRMIIKPTPTNVVEVLMFAVARHIIVHNENIYDTLIGIICIGILFSIRRFLFTPEDKHAKMIFDANWKISEINHFYHLSIPGESDETLREYMTKELVKQRDYFDEETGIVIDNFVFKIYQFKDNEIKKIQLIKLN